MGPLVFGRQPDLLLHFASKEAHRFWPGQLAKADFLDFEAIEDRSSTAYGGSEIHRLQGAYIHTCSSSWTRHIILGPCRPCRSWQVFCTSLSYLPGLL